MMVQRLNASQARQVVKELIPQGLVDYQIPEPVSAGRVEEFCAAVATLPNGRCYGWFDSKLVARGFLVGVIAMNPLTNQKQGVEQAWWSAPKWGRPAIDLLRRFEADCKQEGCKQVMFGYSQFVDPVKMVRLYTRLGYKPHSVSVAKEL